MLTDLEHNTLNVVNVFSLSLPHIGHVGWVSLSLAIQLGILGHVENSVGWRDYDHWRACC